ncbi:hypothetical protein Bca101_010652 [Brassica carinata]
MVFRSRRSPLQLQLRRRLVSSRPPVLRNGAVVCPLSVRVAEKSDGVEANRSCSCLHHTSRSSLLSGGDTDRERHIEQSGSCSSLALGFTIQGFQVGGRDGWIEHLVFSWWSLCSARTGETKLEVEDIGSSNLGFHLHASSSSVRELQKADLYAFFCILVSDIISQHVCPNTSDFALQSLKTLENTKRLQNN